VAGGQRSQFHHVIDIVPTVLEATGIEAPEQVNGITQMPIHGTSMGYCFRNEGAPSRRMTQYFEILGNRAIYHEGWMASCFHGRLPWIRFAGFEFDGPDEQWELYNIEADFSQSENLAEEFPERLEALKALFDREAVAMSVYPLRDAAARRGGDYAVPHSLEGHHKMTYNLAHVRMPEHAVLNLKNVSYRISASVDLPEPVSTGVIACQGGNMGGWSLYLDQGGRPTYLYNWFGHTLTFLASDSVLNEGRHDIVVEYTHDGGFGAGGDAVLIVDGVQSAQGRIPQTVPVIYSMSGETFDVGRDTGSPVGPYPHNFRFSGEIEQVVLERLSDVSAETKSAERRGQFKASLSSQ